MKKLNVKKNGTVNGMIIVVIMIVVCCLGKGGTMSIVVESPAFQQKQSIPVKYTCDGSDISPPLAWQNIPDKTKSIVVICDDPDAPAGTWVHWVCYDIPAHINSIPENMPKADSLPAGGKQGTTDFGRIGYGGPCPPSGTHRYFFKVYALDAVLGLPAGKSKKDVEHAMKGHVLAGGELVGVYSRKQ